MFLFVSATISLSWIFPVDNQNESYYSLVNAGNRQVFEGELEGALENYLEAFKKDHHHFFLDIRKAIVISHKLGLTETKLKLLNKIKQEELIDKASFMGQFEDTTIFSEREIDIIDNFKIAKNPHLKEYYDLIRSYQKVRSMGRDKTLMTDEAWIRDAKCDTYASYRDSMDEKNALLFVEYSEKYGYPFEGNIGISSFPRSEGKQPYITNAFTPFLIKSFLRTIYKDKDRKSVV